MYDGECSGDATQRSMGSQEMSYGNSTYDGNAYLLLMSDFTKQV